MTETSELAPAKINLDLRVCARRSDGYHELDSLVAFTAYGDRLDFAPAEELSLSITGPFAEALRDDPNNLVQTASTLLASFLDRTPNVHITLEKRLPIASGIGGGSADAAATLRGLLRFWQVPMSLRDLAPLARDLGADVPVCLAATSMRMQGIGDRLMPFELPEPLPILLVNPNLPVETPKVFRALERMSGERTTMPRSDDGAAFRAELCCSVNDLETPAKTLAPVIADVLDAISDQSACEVARMSGSGATCFGLFPDQRHLEGAAENLKAAHPDWWIVSTHCRR